MNDIQELLAKAQALGEALAAHPRVKAYQAAQRAVRGDTLAQQLLQDYQSHLSHLSQLEGEHKPVEVADKHKLRDLENRIAAQDSLKVLMRTQADYVELMNQVNQTMEAPLSLLGQPERPA